MNFKDYNDFYLIYLIKEMHCEVSLKILFEKYSVYIKKKISSFKIKGLDYDDFFQEGLICLNKAIEHFDQTYKKTFFKYFDVVLTRRFINLKNNLINKQCSYLDYDYDCFDKNTDIISESVVEYSVREYSNKLNDNEKKVFIKYFILEESIDKISKDLNWNRKKTYNLLFKIRSKIKEETNKYIDINY